MKYMDIWAKPQPRRPRKPVDRGTRLPRRVKDWPQDAQAAFRDVKNQLWKWAKKDASRDRTGLALLAYQGVKEVWEGEPRETIYCETEEDTCQRILSIASKS